MHTSLPFLGLGLGVSSTAALTAPASSTAPYSWCMSSAHACAEGSCSPEAPGLGAATPEWGSHGEQGTCLPAQALRSGALQQPWEGDPLKGSPVVSGRRWKGLRDPKESPFPTAAMEQHAERGHCLLLVPQLGLGWVSPHYGEAGSAIPIPTDSMGRLSGSCGCTCPGSITPQPRSPCRQGASRAGTVSCCTQAAVQLEPGLQSLGSTHLLPASQSTQYHGAPSCQVLI